MLRFPGAFDPFTSHREALKTIDATADIHFKDMSDLLMHMNSSNSRRPVSEILFSIHGFNVDWEGAVSSVWGLYRNVLCCHGPRMPVLMFAWRSMAGEFGSPSFYLPDKWFRITHVAKVSLPVVLDGLLSSVSAHVVAHSMGNTALVRVLRRRQFLHSPFRHNFAFVAPDVDAEEFASSANDYKFRGNASLYCNQADFALMVSARMRFGRSRAGDCKPAPLVIQPSAHIAHFNTVHVVGYKRADSDAHVHSYHVYSSLVGQDIYHFMRDNFAARHVAAKSIFLIVKGTHGCGNWLELDVTGSN